LAVVAQVVNHLPLQVFLQMEQLVAIQYSIPIHQTVAVMVVLVQTRQLQLLAVMVDQAVAVVVADLKQVARLLLVHQAELQQQVTQVVHLVAAAVVVRQHQVQTERQVLLQETVATELHLQ
jgi:hypothetical protein